MVFKWRWRIKAKIIIKNVIIAIKTAVAAVRINKHKCIKRAHEQYDELESLINELKSRWKKNSKKNSII